MSAVLSKLFHKPSLLAVGLILIYSALVAATLTVTQSPTAQAQPCTPQIGTDQDTDIIYSGLSGSTADSMRQSLQTAFQNNNGGNCHQDLQNIYTQASGATTAQLNAILASSNGWTLGYTTHDGKITTDANQVVGTNAQIYSRCWVENTQTGKTNCEPSSNYTQIFNEKSGSYLGVYSHAATFFINVPNNTPERTLIHINQTTGQADFAVWVHCGNAVAFTQIPPMQSLVCKQLVATTSSENGLSYTFTVTASVLNTSTVTTNINFGDSNTSSNSVSNATNGDVTVATFSHTYTQPAADQTITVVTTVNNQPQVGTCATTIHLPGPKSLACVSLNATTSDKKTYSYTATVVENNTTVTSYSFNFGDNSPVVTVPVTSNQTSIVTQHTYGANAPANLTASFTATGPNGTTQAIQACTAPIARTLIVTGPADTIGLFAVASTGGVLLHQIVLRKKLSLGA